MFRSRRAVQVLLPAGIAASGAFAAAIPNNINFAIIDGSTQPTSGFFTYDSAAPLGAQFASFVVLWDGLTFDLTSDANTGGTSFGCGAVNSATTFAILTGTNECPGSAPTIGWQAEEEVANTGFEFIDRGTAVNDISIEAINPFTGSDLADGAFTIGNVGNGQEPEPSSFILALAGGAFLVRKRMRPAGTRSSLW